MAEIAGVRGTEAGARRHAAFWTALRLRVAEDWRADAPRRALWIPVGIGLGIGIYFALPFEPGLGVGLGLVCIAAAAIFALHKTRFDMLGAAALSVALGFTAAELRTRIVAAPVIQEEVAGEVKGRLIAVEGKTEGGLRLVIAPAEISYLEPEELPARVRITLRDEIAGLRPGQWFSVKAVLNPPPGPAMPRGYDFARDAWFEMVGGSGFSIAPPQAIAPLRELSAFEAATDAVNAWRADVAQRIRDGAGGGSTGAIAAALLAGDRAGISVEDNQAMRDSSLAHLLSISGLHMALVGSGIFVALRLLFAAIPFLALRFPVKKWSAAGALAASAFYLVLSGAEVPTQRSFIMLGLMFVAVVCDRAAITMRNVAIAAALILLWLPESLIDVSFQMSFAAVAALVAAYERLSARKRGTGPRGMLRRAGGWAGAAAFTSLVAGLATAPFAAYHFARFTAYGVAANILAMPVVGLVIMPMGMAALALMPFGLETWPLPAMAWGIEVMLDIARWVASWPGAVTGLAPWPLSALALVVTGGLWLALWRRPWRLAGLAPIAAGLLLSAAPSLPDVLIGAEARNVAIRSGEGYALFAATPAFEAEMWLKSAGDLRPPKEAVGGFACDKARCFASVRGVRLAYVLKDAGMAEACAGAAVVVTRVPLASCEGPRLVIGRRELTARGAHALYFEDGGIRVETAADVRGARPWSALKAP